MIDIRGIWWQLGDLSLALAWSLNAATAVGTIAAVGIGTLWIAKKSATVPAALGWMVAAIGLAGAGNAFTTVAFWIATTTATLFLFRRNDENQRRDLYTFAQGAALADLFFFLGYLFYCHTYRDTFLPTTEQFEAASLQLTTFPSKLFAVSALMAGAARVALGSGFLWLTRESRVAPADLAARYLTVLLIPVGLLAQKMDYLRATIPLSLLVTSVAIATLALGAAILHSVGLKIPTVLNPARWVREGFEKPIRIFITVVDRHGEVRTVDSLLLLPSRLGRAAGVWISLLQSGSVASYLTLTALGMAALAAWVLKGGHV